MAAKLARDEDALGVAVLQDQLDLAVADHAVADVAHHQRQRHEDEREVLQHPGVPGGVVDLGARPADVDHQQRAHDDGDQVHRDAPAAHQVRDGLRGLADFCVFENNTVKNCYAIDANHDDGFQSYSGGSGGVKVGQGVVRGVVLRSNTFISYTDPAQPFKAAMQGIGCFDGMFEDWIIENNVVVTDMWHGIALYGAVNCRIVNNTVVKNPINAAARTPWIQISPHKHKQPSTGNLVRNNFTPTLNADASVGTIDHNLLTSDYAAHFVDYAHFDLRLKSTSAAIDHGDPKNAPAVDRDQRPRTASPDIGAYEYTAPLTGEAAAAATLAELTPLFHGLVPASLMPGGAGPLRR